MSPIESYLASLIEPVSGLSLVELNAISSVTTQGNRLLIQLVFPFANGQFVQRLTKGQQLKLATLAGGKTLEW